MSKTLDGMITDLTRAQRDGFVHAHLTVVRSGKQWNVVDTFGKVQFAFQYSAGFYEWLSQCRDRGHSIVPTKSICYLRIVPSYRQAAAEPVISQVDAPTPEPTILKVEQPILDRLIELNKDARAAYRLWIDTPDTPENDQLNRVRMRAAQNAETEELWLFRDIFRNVPGMYETPNCVRPDLVCGQALPLKELDYASV